MLVLILFQVRQARPDSPPRPGSAGRGQGASRSWQRPGPVLSQSKDFTLIEVGFGENGAREIRLCQVCAAQIGAPEIRGTKVDVEQLSARQIGARQMGALEVSLEQLCTRQVGPVQAGSPCGRVGQVCSS